MKKKWQYFAIVLVIWLVYAGFSLYTPQPVTSSKYHLSTTTLNLIIITFEVPFFVCWIYAVAGWRHFCEYINKHPDNLEKKGFMKISRGMLILIIGLIVPTVLSTVYLYFNRHASENSTWVIVSNYINILFPLMGFFWMFRGSLQLMDSIKVKIASWSKIITVLIPVTLFTIFYVALIFTNPARRDSSDPSVLATYFISDKLIVLTIILPVVLTWVEGLLLALNIEQFSNHAPLKLKSALVNFYNGLLIIVGAAILSQALSSLGNARFSKLNLGLILFMIYFLLLIIAVGYGLIARGAKKLART